MLVFLSLYNDQPEAVYQTYFGTVTGAQTNEAPVKYAMKRLAERGRKLDRIIALVTQKAEDTAYTIFEKSIKTEDPDIEIKSIKITDDVTVTDLLKATVDALFPLMPDDSIIIETTGGYRNAINALTLFARFLRYSNIKVEFSTYSNIQKKTVSDTRETDELFDLLDAVNLFAVSGNPTGLKKFLKTVRDIPEKTAFTMAIGDFYDTILCCKMKKMDIVIENLRHAIDGIENAEIEAGEPKLLIFRDLVRKTVSSKMAFIREREYLKPLIYWCLENDYMQQAVTIVWEKMMTNPAYKRSFISDKHFEKVRLLRNDFNHADGGELKGDFENVKSYLRDNILPNL